MPTNNFMAAMQNEKSKESHESQEQELDLEDFVPADETDDEEAVSFGIHAVRAHTYTHTHIHTHTHTSAHTHTHTLTHTHTHTATDEE